ncbi:MAG: hypothetical protein QW478_01630 [Candidatus Micrarchaeaceae archaeon]
MEVRIVSKKNFYFSGTLTLPEIIAVPRNNKELKFLSDNYKILLPSDQFEQNLDYLTSLMYDIGYKKFHNVYFSDHPVTLKIEESMDKNLTLNSYLDFIKNNNKITITQNDLYELNKLNINDIKPDNTINQYIILIYNITHPYYFTVIQQLLINLNLSNIKQLLSLFREMATFEPRTYEKNSLSDEYPMSYYSFRDALFSGKKIDYDLYSTDISALLGYESDNKILIKQFIETLRLYPEAYDIIVSYNVNSLLDFFIRFYLGENLTFIEKLHFYAFLTAFEPSINVERLQKINQFPDFFLDSLYQIYSTPNLNQILLLDEHPLEKYLYILSLINDNNQIIKLAYKIGMAIPEQLDNSEIKMYVIKYIHLYRDVVTRKNKPELITQRLKKEIFYSDLQLNDILKHYTDFEIIEQLGYYCKFKNRPLMISDASHFIAGQTFAILNDINNEYLQNTVETSLKTPIKFLNKPYLVFGNIYSYKILEIKELYNLTGYSVKQVKRLYNLLDYLLLKHPNYYNDIKYIKKKIKMLLASSYVRNNEIDVIFEQILKSKNQNIYKEYLYKLYYLGLYLNNWEGVTHEKPTGSDTRVSYYPNMVSKLIANELDKNIILDLPLIDFTPVDTLYININKIKFIIDKIKNNEVIENNYGKQLNKTSKFYLRLFFNEIL